MAVHPKEIVAYAHRISGTTSAPSYWRPGLPMFGFTPPAPQEQMMRAGVLSRGVVDEVVTTEPEKIKTAVPSSSVDRSLLTKVNVPLGISLPQDLELAKLLPPGWKPGDKLELPADMVIPHVTAEYVQVTKDANLSMFIN